MRQKILCVEDEQLFQAMIRETLRDYQVTMARSLVEAKSHLETTRFDAIILDILLPDGDGLKFWAQMHSSANCVGVPIMFVTGQTDISNKVLAFSVGADDFIAKPFDPIELKIRIERRLKSAERAGHSNSFRWGNLLLDLTRQKAFHIVNDKEVDLTLTSTEIKILHLFGKRLDQVFSREQILTEVWGNANVSDRTVDSHVAHLRSKIKDTDVEIQTMKNLGYYLKKKA